MRRQAAYLRVSTAEQSEAMQREAIDRAATARGAPVDVWFSDVHSRDRYDRPGLDSLRKAARRGELAIVWVWKLDRLGAGALELLTVVREVRGSGAGIRSVVEGLDTQGPFGDAIIAVIGAMAESELESIRERTAEARKRAELAGKHWGRPRAGSAEQRAQLRELVHNQGLTLRKAAEKAGLSFSAAQRLLAADRQER